MSKEPRSILVVDDAPANISVLVNALSDLYRVRAATSGPQALRICRSDDPPDLVLLDVVMPDMDGFEVCRQLKADQKTSEIPVIFVSSLENPDDEIDGFSAGAVDFIVKPISLPMTRRRISVHFELLESQRRAEGLSKRFSRYLSPELTQSLINGEVAAEVGTRRKKLTVVFTDIVGFTHQTETLAPEDMSFLLNSYFAAMAEIVVEHGGTFDKYIGDALMLFFGDPRTRGAEADARSCIEMAIAMQNRVAELGTTWLERGIPSPLTIRIGIATGYCTVGNFGSPHKLEYTVMGGPVNLAARLESKATPGGILVSEATYALVREHFPFVPAPAMALKGLPDGIAAFEVVVDVRESALIHDSTGVSLRVLPHMIPASEAAGVAAALRRFADRVEALEPDTAG